MSGKQQKVTKLTTFYGNQVARPYVVFKEDGQVDKDRVDAPKINDALIAWASQVPFEQGGGLVKPTYEGAQSVREARTDFQIFLTEGYADILAANPGLIDASDRKTLLAVASAFWRYNLSPEERKAYHDKATGAFTGGAGPSKVTQRHLPGRALLPNVYQMDSLICVEMRLCFVLLLEAKLKACAVPCKPRPKPTSASAFLASFSQEKLAAPSFLLPCFLACCSTLPSWKRGYAVAPTSLLSVPAHAMP
jgi:hypothetical protein